MAAALQQRQYEMYSVNVANDDGSQMPAVCMEHIQNGQAVYSLVVFKRFMSNSYGADYGEKAPIGSLMEMTLDAAEHITRLPLDERVYRSWINFVRGDGKIEISLEGLRLLVENWHPNMSLEITRRVHDYGDPPVVVGVSPWVFLLNGNWLQIVDDLTPGILARQRVFNEVREWKFEAANSSK